MSGLAWYNMADLGALTADLRALVEAKELKLEEALELNKQIAPKDPNADLPTLRPQLLEGRSLIDDLVDLRTGPVWDGEASVLVSRAALRRRRDLASDSEELPPPREVNAYCDDSHGDGSWVLLSVSTTECSFQPHYRKGNHSVETDPATKRLTRVCQQGHRMVQSNYKYNKYGEWECDQCHCVKTGPRWFCRDCAEDYCFHCSPRVAQVGVFFPRAPTVVNWGKYRSGRAFLSQFGSDQKHNRTDIVEARVFACSLNTPNIVHFKTKCADFLNYVYEHNGNGEKCPVPWNRLLVERMPGHNVPSLNCSLLKNYFKGGSHMPKKGGSTGSLDRDTISASLLQVWVRFRDDLLVSPNEHENSGPFVKEAKPSMESRASTNSLAIVKQPTLDEETVENMVTGSNYHIEMQRLMLLEAMHDKLCFLCNGTGLSYVAAENSYGNREDDGVQESKSCDEPGLHSVPAESAVETTSRALGISTVVFLTRNPMGVVSTITKEISDGVETVDDTSKRAKQYGYGNKIAPSPEERLRKKFSEATDRCWACKGTGKKTQMVEAMESIVDEDDDEDCLICWCDPQKYGISTECTHFFCETCIKTHLETIVNSGKFPGYCPICLANTPKGETPRYGRITGKAMTFLERRGIITKEFQFRFMRKQEEEEGPSFFECPWKCGNFLIDVKPTYVLKGGDVLTRVERCPCKKGVCVQCHQKVEDSKIESHKCPDKNRSQAQDDVATLAWMKKVGKKCPNCSMFLVKNAGCDVMMCGDKAHGDLRRAIKNGGCGQCFYWSSLKRMEDTVTNLNGQRIRCDPPKKYATEIAAYKKKNGLVLTDGEKESAKIFSGTGALPLLGDKIRELPTKHGQQLYKLCCRNDTEGVLHLLAGDYTPGARSRVDVDFRANVNGGWGENGHMIGTIATVAMIPLYVLLSLCRGHLLWDMMLLKSFAFTALYIFLLVVWGPGTLDPLTEHASPTAIIAAIFVALPAAILSCRLSHITSFNTPLTIAARLGNIDIFKALLMHNASIDRTADSNITPAMAVVCSRAMFTKKRALCDAFVAHGGDLHEGATILESISWTPNLLALCCCQRVKCCLRLQSRRLLWQMVWFPLTALSLALLLERFTGHGTCGTVDGAGSRAVSGFCGDSPVAKLNFDSLGVGAVSTVQIYAGDVRNCKETEECRDADDALKKTRNCCWSGNMCNKRNYEYSMGKFHTIPAECSSSKFFRIESGINLDVQTRTGRTRTYQRSHRFENEGDDEDPGFGSILRFRIRKVAAVVNHKFQGTSNVLMVKDPYHHLCVDHKCTVENDHSQCCRTTCASIPNSTVAAFCDDEKRTLIKSAAAVLCNGPSCTAVDRGRCCRMKCKNARSLCSLHRMVVRNQNINEYCTEFECQSDADLRMCCQQACSAIPFGERAHFCGQPYLQNRYTFISPHKWTNARTTFKLPQIYSFYTVAFDLRLHQFNGEEALDGALLFRFEHESSRYRGNEDRAIPPKTANSHHPAVFIKKVDDGQTFALRVFTPISHHEFDVAEIPINLGGKSKIDIHVKIEVTGVIRNVWIDGVLKSHKIGQLDERTNIPLVQIRKYGATVYVNGDDDVYRTRRHFLKNFTLNGGGVFKDFPEGIPCTSPGCKLIADRAACCAATPRLFVDTFVPSRVKTGAASKTSVYFPSSFPFPSIIVTAYFLWRGGGGY